MVNDGGLVIKMSNRFLVALLLSASLCVAADGNQIRQLFQSILSESPDRVLPTPEEVDSKVRGADILEASEVEMLLPLAAKCLRSSNIDMQRDGLLLFSTVGLRPDSAKLLDPYVEDLMVLITDPMSPFKVGAASVFLYMKPKMSPRATAALSTHLEDGSNTAEQKTIIAGCLLNASPLDAAILHRVLTVVRELSDDKVMVECLRELGLLRTRNPEALSFIGKGLDSPNPHIRQSAVDAVSRLERDLRVGFAAQLGRIAADNNEPKEVRSQAAQALR
jgi:HEAT repeats